MMLLTVSVAAFLLSGMSRISHQLSSPFHNTRVLAEAKNALIAYARLSDPDLSADTGLNYRYLPCPDQDGDGLAESPCGASSVEGWLPWMSLGLAPLRDASGTCLRYFVAAAYKQGTATPPLVSALPNAEFTLNSRSGLVAADVVAVLIAPGNVVAGQSRSAAPGNVTECGSTASASKRNQADNYMDTTAGINNALAPDFILSPLSLNDTGSFNDVVISLLSGEL
ncbi:MAG: hypothetical protein COA75_07165 [Cellvibrionales bacterium]|nr:MAG: hypothetical protein COA75_07165 [Cellvibrionales bacterium]